MSTFIQKLAIDAGGSSKTNENFQIVVGNQWKLKLTSWKWVILSVPFVTVIQNKYQLDYYVRKLADLMNGFTNFSLQ